MSLRATAFLTALLAAVIVTGAAEIPARPEQLKFPELKYDPPNPADYRVQLRTGPVAYVIEDHELPLVNILILVRAGQYLEPAEQRGLAGLTGALLVRGGAGDRTAEELEERLDFLAAAMRSSIGESQGTVSLNLLSKDLDEGLAILRDVLTRPRFQEDKLRLFKEQTLQMMKQRNDDSADIEARERDRLAHGEDFWATQLPTAKTLDAIRRDDLKRFHQRWFHPASFVVAASGDFDRGAMIGKLERLFADWPFKGETPPEIPKNTTFAKPGVYLVDKDVNQGRVSILLPGFMRDHPDYFPVTIMNDILGGGGFTSRIMNRVRSDEGLAYSAGSAFPGGVHYPSAFSAQFQSKSPTVAHAASIVVEEMKRLAGGLVSDEELHTSKRSFIDTFPRIFATRAQTAARFADDEFTGRYARDPEYWAKYRERVDAVTKEDVLRVARKWLNTDQLVILAVGQKKQILEGRPDYPVKLTDLMSGGVTELPLRDPLTLEPLAGR